MKNGTPWLLFCILLNIKQEKIQWSKSSRHSPVHSSVAPDRQRVGLCVIIGIVWVLTAEDRLALFAKEKKGKVQKGQDK